MLETAAVLSAMREPVQFEGPVCTWGGTETGILKNMAARTPAPEKRPGLVSQIKTLLTFTKEVYPWLGWVLIAIIIAGIGIGVGIGFLIPPVAIWSIILWGVTGILIGFLGAMITMSRLATKAMYAKIDGKPGATGYVMNSGLGRGWRADDMPVGVNPKTQDAVYRAVGRAGILIVGEGSEARLTRLINEEKMKAKRVAPSVPVHVMYVGNDEGQVSIKVLGKTAKALPKVISKATQAAVVKRMDSMTQGLGALPIPKGIDPTKVRAPRPR